MMCPLERGNMTCPRRGIGCGGEGKFEIRNSKFEANPKTEFLNSEADRLGFRISSFFRVSIFEFRISYKLASDFSDGRPNVKITQQVLMMRFVGGRVRGSGCGRATRRASRMRRQRLGRAKPRDRGRISNRVPWSRAA